MLLLVSGLKFYFISALPTGKTFTCNLEVQQHIIFSCRGNFQQLNFFESDIAVGYLFS